MKRILQAATVIAAMIAGSAQAIVYDVNHSFTDTINDSPSSATLTGTLDIPLGSYTVDANSSAWPFTAVDLTLTVDGTPYNLNQALPIADSIGAAGEFSINATPTTLTFNVIADTDLFFSDTSGNNQYFIGWDSYPGYEVASTETAWVGAPVTFGADPIVFGTAVVPEPGSFMLTAVGFVGLYLVRRFSRKASDCSHQ